MRAVAAGDVTFSRWHVSGVAKLVWLVLPPIVYLPVPRSGCGVARQMAGVRTFIDRGLDLEYIQ